MALLRPVVEYACVVWFLHVDIHVIRLEAMNLTQIYEANYVQISSYCST